MLFWAKMKRFEKHKGAAGEGSTPAANKRSIDGGESAV